MPRPHEDHQDHQEHEDHDDHADHAQADHEHPPGGARRTDAPTVVGINRTQDGSVAVTRGGTTMCSLQKERLSRRKHHWGRLGDLPRLYKGVLPHLDGPVDVVVEGWSSDDELDRIEEYHQELRDTLTLAPDARIVQVSHHLTHLYSAFYPSPYDVAAGIVVDAQGSRVKHLTEAYDVPAGTDVELLEISSFYRCERGRVVCIAKQLWDGDWSRPAGLGCFYSMLTRMLWPEGEGNEGKVMGLAPFGDPAAMGLPPLEVRGHEVFIGQAWLDQLADRGTFLWTGDPESFSRCADLAAAGQMAFEDALMQLVIWLHEQTGLDDLVFAGGCGLNCSANGELVRSSPFRDVFIPPSPHDGGTAVGCAVYGLVDCLGVRTDFRWDDDFLGPTPTRPRSTRPSATCPRDSSPSSRTTSSPRWSTCSRAGVLADHAERVFDVDRPAPFMQYAADVRPEFRDTYPGITHVDGTARLQTVEPVHTPFLHALLTAWYERTGSPVLLNTSLNGPGDPLRETPEQSLATLERTGIHALALPPYLVRETEEPPVPGQGWRRPARPVDV